MAIQVFEIDDCEWWAGDCSPADILRAYNENCGNPPDQPLWDGQLPCALTDEQLDRMKFVHDDDGEMLETPLTFRQQLAHLIAKGEKFPCFFATTEW